jgi:DNA-binding response OmpR family regulator
MSELVARRVGQMANKQQQQTILVVNDTQEILDRFRDLLSAEGYGVATLAFSTKQIEAIAALQPHLIILDLVFDREYIGWQTLQKVRMHRATVQIPVLVCTAELRRAQEMEGFLAERGIGVLIKPFDSAALIAQVQRLLTGVSPVAASQT